MSRPEFWKKTRHTLSIATLLLCQSTILQAFTAPAPAWGSSDQQPHTGGIVAPLQEKLETALSLLSQLLPSSAYAAESAWSDTREIHLNGEITGYLQASIQNGWLHARRLDADREPIWHVVLARANASAPPTLKTGTLLEVRHADGRYFIRDLAGRGSAACEKPETDPMSGVDLTHLQSHLTQSSGQAGGLQFTSSKSGQWIWMIVGHQDRPWQIAVRMSPDILVPETGRVGGSGIGLVEFQRDDATLTYDGETLQARYITMEETLRELNRRNLQAGTLPPEIDAERWLNPPTKTFKERTFPVKKLAYLHGRVVLLDFWATWCTPCVAKLPSVQKLHEEYADRGLVVVAVHSAHNADQMDTFLQKHDYTFPIILDTGETLKRYGIEGIPKYALIGKDGTLVSSGLRDYLPDEEEIEKLLAAAGS